MRRSPTSPLILKRRKLPFHQNATDSQPGESGSKEPSKPAAAQRFPGGIRIMDHPSMSDTQVVVIPETAEVQSVIGALTAKGNECGAQGPKKFILLSGSGSGNKWDYGPDSQSAAEGAATRSTEGHKVKAETTRSFPVNKDVTCNPLDDSLTDMQWLGKMSTCILEPNSTKHLSSKENQNPLPQTFQNKFILLSGSASVNMWDFGPDSQSAAEEAAAMSTEGHKVKAETTRSFPVNKDVNYGPLDDSLGRMSTCDLEPNSTKQLSSKENQNPLQTFQAHDTHTSADAPQQPISERPPYSYMAMIQFAINSRKNRRMTLKEIYMWIEDNFPYYRDVAKPGWKNSIRHNLSLHDMFIRETSPDGKMSFWTIRPEANRCLTLDHVYKEPSSNHTQAALNREGTKKPRSTKRGHFQMEEKHQLALRKKMKPLPLQTDSCFVPIQLPVTPSVYLPSTSCSQQKGNNSRAAKRVRIAPKVTQSHSPAVMISPQKNTDFKVEVKEELVCVPIKCETPKAPPKRQASSSQRKQRFVHPVNEEPVLLCHENNFFDSGVASDASTFHFTLSTPSKPPSYVASFKVTPVGKGSQNILHLSPICAPGGPTVTPQHDNTTFSFSSTPFKDLPLFNSPRELLTSAPSRVTGPAESPTECLKSSCSRELLQGGGSTGANRSITEGLVLDTMNDSLSKILLDISFSSLDDDDSGMANISWSDLIPQLNTDTI